MFLVIFILYSYKKILGFLPSVILRYNKVVIFMLVLFSSVQIIWTIILQYSSKMFWEEIYENINQDGIAYTDKELVNTPLSRFMLIHPVGAHLNNEWHYRALWMYYKTPFISIVPKTLKNIDIKEATILEGNLKARKVKGYIVTDYIMGTSYNNPSVPAIINILITLKDQTSINTTGIAFPLITSPRSNLISKDTLSFIYIPINNIEIDKIQTIDSISTSSEL